MKILIVLICILLVLAQGKITRDERKRLSGTAEEIKEYIAAFFIGFDVYGKINPTQECVVASDDALTYFAAAVENYANQNFYEGTLNISDSLGALSPLARQCDKSIDKMIELTQNYPKQFKSTADFFIKFGLNLLGNIKPLLDRTIFVKNEIVGKGNTTAVVQTIAEMINLQFTINKILKSPMMSDVVDSVLKYTRADPLAPSPVGPLLWNIYEGTYNLLISSKFISSEHLVECQGATLNMVLFNIDASNNFEKNDQKYTKLGVYSVLDSFQFLHQAVEGCTQTAIEIGHRSALIDEQVLANPSVIWKNAIHNIWFILSDGLYGYSSNYYSDFISMMDSIGDFFYRTITYNVQSA
jgi:hypothetical protein